MKLWLIAPILAMGLVAGCGGPSGDGSVQTAKMANPSGQPRNEQEATQATLQQQAGESAKAHMAEAAKAMKDAQNRAGAR